MNSPFDKALRANHDLYHLRFGRGAVIVAIRRDDRESTGKDSSKYGKYVAGLYNNRGPGNYPSAPDFEPILSIQEDGDFLRILVQFDYRNRLKPTDSLVLATIERVIPLSQITLEIVRTTDPNAAQR